MIHAYMSSVEIYPHKVSSFVLFQSRERLVETVSETETEQAK